MSDALRTRALRFLARREHARVELGRKLASHAESTEAVETLLDNLEAAGLLSDARYAEMRVSARSGRLGNARLAQEMRQQGVAAEKVDEALAAGEDELVRARQVWRKKFGEQPSREAVERARQIRFLMGRGFSGETVRRVLRNEPEEE